jgi:hypothetical protein
MTDSDDDIPPGYARVTEVLEPYTSFDGIDSAVLKKAADRGTRVHKYCELYVQNLLIEKVDGECKPYVDSFIQWFDSMVKEVWVSEMRLSCSKYFISGKLDLIVTLKGDTTETLVDLKTPQQASQSWQLQTAAYRYLIRVSQGIDITRRVCLILDKEGKLPRLVEYTDHERDERLFLSAAELFHFFNK